MPLLKANEALPERSVVIGYYGEPGVKKTSIAHTAEEPLLIDFDRGVARSWGRKDVIIVDNWQEVLKHEQEGLFAKYKTIIIDTAKAALDDFLMVHVVQQDYKLQKNKLQAYGAIGDEFKRFLNARRAENVDVIIIAHAKKDEDTKKVIPDVTGQSYNLILRVADQIGFVSTKNNQSVIQWSPTDTTVGKNTANLPEAIIPDKSVPEFKTFMSDIIRGVKTAIAAMSEEQREALQQLEKYTAMVNEATTIDSLKPIVEQVAALPKSLVIQLLNTVREKARSFVAQITEVEKLNEALQFFTTAPMQLTKPDQDAIKKVQDAHKWTFDKASKLFSAPAPTPAPAAHATDDDPGLKKAIPGETFTDQPVVAANFD